VAKYRKKPVVVEAMQYTGNNLEEALAFCTPVKSIEDRRAFVSEEDLVIKTLEGSMLVSKKDYIIKGIKGEFYPCKPDIFAATYEEV